MGKVFWQISTSLDGFMEGPGGDLSRTAQVADKDFDAYASRMLEGLGAFVIGRRTYELFVSYWPTAAGHDGDILNSLPKLVASGTLEKAEWNNARLIRDNVADEVTRLKGDTDKDVAIFGSANLASSLFDVIDEFRILVTPNILGAGTPTFTAGARPSELKLKRTETWTSGTVALFYGR